MTKATMPDPGEGRWWEVTLVKNVEKNPIKVALMESQVKGRKALSTQLRFARTIATPEKVAEAADLVLVRVGGYANVIGMYFMDEEGE